MRNSQVLKELKTINSEKVKVFLAEYHKIVEHKNIPELKISTIKKLYERWLESPSIIKDILFFSEKMNDEIEDEHFWMTLINSKYHFNNQTKKYRYFLLALFFNKNVIDKGSTQEFLLLIKLVLNVQIDSSIISESVSKTEDFIESRYSLMIFWSKLIVENPKLTYSERNRLFTSVLKRKYINNIDSYYLKFIKHISNAMDMFYVLRYSDDELKFLFEIFQANPIVFEVSKGRKVRDFKICIFENYIIPPLFFNKFYELNQIEKNLLIHILKGGSLHKAPHLPFTVTKKAAHIFRSLDRNDFRNISEGLIYSNFITQNVSEEYALQALGSIRNIEQADFWVDTLSNFYKKGLVSHDLSMVIDYINNEQFIMGSGKNWKKMKVHNLLLASEKWHLNTYNEDDFFDDYVDFEKSEVSGYSYNYKLKNEEVRKYYIKQLLSSDELYDEGDNLNHCVYSYVSYCVANFCQIFSLRVLDENEITKSLITIELREKKISQALGEFNREPNAQELKIINHWANKEGLEWY